MGDLAAHMACGVLDPEDIGMDPFMVMALGGGDFFGGVPPNEFDDDDEEPESRPRPSSDDTKDKAKAKRKSETKQDEHMCDVCKVPVQPAVMAEHVAGRKHKAALSKQGHAGTQPATTAAAPASSASHQGGRRGKRGRGGDAGGAVTQTPRTQPHPQ